VNELERREVTGGVKTHERNQAPQNLKNKSDIGGIGSSFGNNGLSSLRKVRLVLVIEKVVGGNEERKIQSSIQAVQARQKTKNGKTVGAYPRVEEKKGPKTAGLQAHRWSKQAPG